MIEITPPTMSEYVTRDMRVVQPEYEKMDTEFKRGKKDPVLEKLLKDRTGEYYKVWKITLNE